MPARRPRYTFVNESVRQPVYVFEGFRLDAQRRVLLGADGQPIPLTPRLFDTLLYFVERAGQLLTKEQLLEAIWPNVVVEEHNLNKTVSELRRVLGEKPGEHRFIVTKPGRGYRFVANVSIGPASAEAVSGLPRQRYSRWTSVTVLLATLGAGIAFVGYRTLERDQPPLRFAALSTEKGGQRGPVWSPDGREVVYAARSSLGEPFRLYVRALDSSAPREIAQLVDSDLGVPLQWTTDNKILFLDRKGLWQVSPVSGAPPEQVADVDFDFHLYGPAASKVMHATRDGKLMVSVGRTDDGSIRVFTATLPDAKFTRYEPDPFAATNEVPFVRFSPDGKQLLLLRSTDTGQQAWLLPIPADASRPPRQVLDGLPPANKEPEFSWLADSRHVVISATVGPAVGPKTLYLADTRSERFRLLGGTQLGRNAQVAPVASPDGDKLIYTDRQFDFDVVTFDLKTAIIKPVLDSRAVEQLPSWGRNAAGDALVYVSFASGVLEIWLHQAGHPPRAIVTPRDFGSSGTFALVAPALSPNGGTRVIYQRAEGPGGGSSALWMSPVGGGAPEKLTNESGRETAGSWSHDGAWFVYFTHEAGVDVLKKVRTTGRAAPVPLRRDLRILEWLPVWSPDGEWILVPDSGVLVSDDGTQTRSLGSDRVACTFAPTESKLYCIRPPQSDGRHPVVALDFDGRVVDEIGSIAPEHFPKAGLRPGVRLSLTPDGTGLTYSINKVAEDLWLVEGLGTVELP